jgi:hypothetical protein
MIFHYTASNIDEYKILKEKLNHIQPFIDEQRKNIHPSFRCIFIDVNGVIHVLVKVHLSALFQHNMIWKLQHMLNNLGLMGFLNIKRASFDFLNQVSIPAEAVYYGDDKNSFLEHDLLVVRRMNDAHKIYEPNEFDLAPEYSKLISFEREHIHQEFFNRTLQPFLGHKKHYIFTSSDEPAEKVCNVLLHDLHSFNLLPGNEVMNICFNSESLPRYGLHEALELWQGNSVKIMFFEDFNHNTELRKTIIVDMIKALLKEFGKTILFIFFFHDNTKNIQKLLMDDKYAFEFVEFNNRDFTYEEACEYLKKEAYKYWVDEKQLLEGLKNDINYCRDDLKSLMVRLSTGNCA